MAGITVPTVFLLIAMTVFTIARYVYDVPLQIERVIVFPMAIVPNAWGVWNILYVALMKRRRISIGIFGALLPLPLVSGGYLLARHFDFAPQLIHAALPIAFPVALVLYYLLWKHVVASLNEIVGIR